MERADRFLLILRHTKAASLFVEDVASAAHAGWKRDHLASRGGDPRWKPTLDRTVDVNAPWYREKDGSLEVALAWIDYENLPSDWRKENQSSGETLLTLFESLLFDGRDIFSSDTINWCSAQVHDAWLKRSLSPTEMQEKPQAEFISGARAGGKFGKAHLHLFLMDLNFVLAGLSALLKLEQLYINGLEPFYDASTDTA